jgi:hypothetical protein
MSITRRADADLRRIAATIVIASLVLGGKAAAQQPLPTPPPLPPGWLPRTIYVSESNGITAADHQTIRAILGAIESLLRNVEEFGRPRGFEIWGGWAGGLPTPARDRIQEYEFGATVFEPTKKAVGEGPSPVGVTVNPSVARISASRLTEDAQGRPIYLENRTAPQPYAGSTVTYGSFESTGNDRLGVLFTSGRQPLTVGVSREAVLNALIYQAEKGQRQSRESSGGDAYQEWMREAPLRRQREEAILAMLPDKAQADKMRAEFEKTEREATERLKKSAPSASAELARVGGVIVKKYRDQLAALTPSERAAPAWVLGADVVAAGTPHALRAVMENTAFYRARRSPFEPRAIFMVLYRVDDWPNTQRALAALNQKLDWAAFNRFIDQRP